MTLTFTRTQESSRREYKEQHFACEVSPKIGLQDENTLMFSPMYGRLYFNLDSTYSSSFSNAKILKIRKRRRVS